ncbi:hypothetical protein JTB14_003394 [Gonioctena quinquepunctata]|nr:hypothetical protein JTB14_003394 [Gonioctena quinquepunctata]
MLYSKTLKERVPTLDTKLIPASPNHNEIKQKILRINGKQKLHFDTRHKTNENKELNEGDRVWIDNMQREERIDNIYMHHQQESPRQNMNDSKEHETGKYPNTSEILYYVKSYSNVRFIYILSLIQFDMYDNSIVIPKIVEKGDVVYGFIATESG